MWFGKPRLYTLSLYNGPQAVEVIGSPRHSPANFILSLGVAHGAHWEKKEERHLIRLTASSKGVRCNQDAEKSTVTHSQRCIHSCDGVLA